MSNLLQSYIDPQSTDQLSNYLNNLESSGKNDSKRSEYIRNEMRILELQLDITRDQVSMKNGMV